ncbi:MAG: murein biosynthesis integral membrane protein MurJ [bacterium]|nr:murein biosynthesis integral membrane protein MurJ [bacterium]
MNRLIRKATSKISVGNAAILLASTTMIGQVLGFLRVKFINANFPATGEGSTDVFFAAFKIPDFFYLTLAAGALGVAFIPYLSDKLSKNDRQGAWDLSSSLLNLLAIVMGVVGILIFVFAEPLIDHVVAPGMTDFQLERATLIMRLVALNPLLFTLSSILMSMQQTTGRFFFFAIAPLFYNLSIIISIFVFKDNLGIVGLGVGAMIGAVLQLLVALVGLIGMKFKYNAKIQWHSPSFRGILRQLPPRSIDQGVDGINSIVETNFARGLGEGNITYYENAYVLHTAPILLIGTTISTAAFPRMTRRLSQGRPDLFRKEFRNILRMMIWISLPVITVSYFARGYLARLIFSRDAPEIALIFGFFTAAILFRIVYNILSRYFYAYKDTVTPLLVSLGVIALNVGLAFILSQPENYGVAGLAIAQAIVAIVEAFILTAIIYYRDRKIFDYEFVEALLRMLSATGFTVVVAYIMIQVLPLSTGDTGVITLGGKLVMISVATFGTFGIMSWLLKIEEVYPVIEKLKKLILKPIRINY